MDRGGWRPLTSLYEMIGYVCFRPLCTFVTLWESGVCPLLMASTHFFYWDYTPGLVTVKYFFWLFMNQIYWLVKNLLNKQQWINTWNVSKDWYLISVLFAYDEQIMWNCRCDDGGDCECLCTAVAAFAKECSSQGINVKWRSNRFCRMYFSFYKLPLELHFFT